MRSFTLIELIMTFVVVGIVMVPLGLMCGEYIRGVVYSEDLTIGESLAMTELAKVNNLSYSDATLEDGDDDTYSNYEGYDINIRREVDYVAGTSNNLKKVVVTAYEATTSAELLNLVTYIADVPFGPGSSGSDANIIGEASFLAVTGGAISAKTLRNIDMENTSTVDDITIDQVTVSWGGSNTLTTIIIDGVTRWSGSLSTSGTTIDITDFTLTAGTSYDNTGRLTFSSNLSSATLVFIMMDTSESAEYSW